MNAMETNDRTIYRQRHNAAGLVYYRVVVGETDICVATEQDRREQARKLALEARAPLEAYIAAHADFAPALTPLDPAPDAPELVRRMCAAAAKADVGPMAAVAGAISAQIGEGLCPHGEEVIVENGGDLFIQSAHERCVDIYAGPSPLSQKLAIVLPPGRWGVATSAGTFGHSLSFGRADAAVVVSHDAALADAAATALGNRLQTAADIESALAWTLGLAGVCGALCIIDGALGVQGGISLRRL